MGPAKPGEVVGIPEFVLKTHEALEGVEAMDVRWRNTRFERYLRHLEALATMQFPGPFPWRGDAEKQRLLFEATSQCQQLIDSHGIWGIGRRLARPRLEKVFSGSDLSPTESDESDEPRNTLFELATAAALARAGFVVELPEGEEDLRATLPGLSLPILVECKRPAHSGSLPKNLKKARHQLKERRTPEKDYGLVVVGVDRLLDVAAPMVVSTSEAVLVSALERELLAQWRNIIRIGRKSQQPLFPHASIGAILLTGTVFPRDRGILFTVSLMRLFCTGPESHATSQRFIEACTQAMPMNYGW